MTTEQCDAYYTERWFFANNKPLRRCELTKGHKGKHILTKAYSDMKLNPFVSEIIQW